jgi:homoserine kinase
VPDARSRLDGVTIEVPGSSANLGAGFDALAVAVQVYLRITVQRIDDNRRGTVHGVFKGVALEGQDYVTRAFTEIAARERLDFPSMEIEIASDIPMQAGLGSSAAATVAGLLLYQRLDPAFATDADAAGQARDLLAEGTRFEGHPDNVAASLLGGLTVACSTGAGVVAVSNRWPDAIRLIAATPDVRVKTPDARRVLPDTLSRPDAIFNLQRAALLVAGIAAGRTDVLREALADRWHQPYRAALVPGLAEALKLDAPGLLGVCLSGSGPTVVALAEGDTSPVERALAGVYATLGIPCTVRVLSAHNGPPRVRTGAART